MAETEQRVKTDEEELLAVLLDIEAGNIEPTATHIADARFCIQRLLKRMDHINRLSNF